MTALEKLRFWTSEEYGKYVDAKSALADAVIALQDELEKLEPIVEVIISKLDEDDADGLALFDIADNCSNLTWKVLDQWMELSLAID